MLIAISVFCFIHPAKYLGSRGGLSKAERAEGGVQLVENDALEVGDGRRHRRERK